MKKFLKIMLVVGMVSSLIMCSACKKADDSSSDNKSKAEVITDPEEVMFDDSITVDEFYEKVEGCWVYEGENKNFDVICFEDGKVDNFKYCSEVWLGDGIIKDIKKVGDKFEIRIEYIEDCYDEEPSETPSEITFLIGSNDNFDKNLILVGADGTDYNYEYMGKTFDEAEEILSKKMFS